MPITPSTTTGNFDDVTYDFIVDWEGNRNDFYSDSIGIPTVGVGTALIIKNGSAYEVRSDLDTLFTDVHSFSQSEHDKLDDIVSLLNSGDVAGASDELVVAKGNGLFNQITDTGTTTLYNRSLDSVLSTVEATHGQNWLDIQTSLAGSKELKALYSLAYNSPSLIGSGLIDALVDGDRARAWAEMLYHHQNTDIEGLMSRREAEADLFGLLDAGADWQDYLDALDTLQNGTFENGESIWDIINARDEYVPINDMLGEAANNLGEPQAGNDNATDNNGDGRQDGTGGGSGSGDGGPQLPKEPNTPGGQGSPLVLDLDGDGIELYAKGDYGTYFDLRGTGQAVLTGWVEPDDGLLAYDVNGNGIIDDISELFGNETTDGFAELRAYDSNGDGVIDANDTVFNDLVVWTDTNSTGRSQNAELHSLSDLGITAISLDAVRVAGQEISGNAITHEASFTINGLEQSIVDAWFEYDVTYTRNNEDFTFDLRAASLPTLRAYGDLKDLHIAASIDNGATSDTLIEQLIAFSSSKTVDGVFSDWGAVKADVDTLMLRWAGVDAVDPASRGAFVDARHLAFYEAFSSEPFEQYGQPNPLREAGDFSEAVYDYLVKYHTVQLTAQLIGNEIFTDPSYSVYAGGTTGDLALLQTGIDAVKDTAIAAVDAVDVWTHFAQFLGYTKGLGNLTAAEVTALDTAVAATGEAALSDWQDVVTAMTATLGSIIDSADDWGSFEVFYDNYNPGTGGDDVMVDNNAGGHTDNEFRGFAGNDTIQGLDGHDKLMGGDGNDTLEGGTGDDYLLGGLGDDIYLFESGNDTISEVDGGGTDVLHIMASTGLTHTDLTDLYRLGDEMMLLLSTGDLITVHGYNGTDTRLETVVFDADGAPEGTIDLTSLLEEKFYGTDKADDIAASGQNFQTMLVYGYAGNDILTAAGSAGLFYGGDGYDTLTGDYQPDEFYGDAGDDYLAGLGGDDVLNGGDNNDVLDGGDGNDTLNGNLDEDRLYGGAGDDALNGGYGDDIHDGGAGNDTMEGTHGNDTYIFGLGYGQDWIYDTSTQSGSRDDVLLFNADVLPTDVIVSRDANASILFTIDGTTDTVKLYKQEFYSGKIAQVEHVNFAVDGTEWTPDDLRVMAIDTATTDGDDTVYGFAYAQDYIDAGLGNDYMNGLEDDDTYVFGLGYGQDTIEEQGGYDQLSILADIAPGDVTVTRGTSASIILSVDGTTDSVTLFEQELNAYNYNRVDEVVFSVDSTIWTAEDLRLMAIASQITAGDDAVTGFDTDDVLWGDAGNDTILGLDGNDTLEGGAGDDVLNGGNNTDTALYSNAAAGIVVDLGAGTASDGDGGSDTLTSIENVTGSAFDDVITGKSGVNTLDGGAGNDVLSGGAGNDNLNGGTGNDAYVFNLGDGQDVISDESGLDDAVSFGAGFNIEDLTFTETGSTDLSIGFTGLTDTVLLSQQRDAGNDFKIESLKFEDGFTVSVAGYMNWLWGTSGNDVVAGGANDDVLIGDAGTDTIYGGAGNDALHGGADDDTLFGEAGDDFLHGGAGTDMVDYSTSAAGVVVNLGAGTASGDGNDTLVGIENVTGSAFDDVIEGDANVNALFGGAGSDKYIWADGDGDDVVTDSDGADDVLSVASGLRPEDLIFTETGTNDLEVTFATLSGSITLMGQRDVLGTQQVEWIEFDDGMRVDLLRYADWNFGTASGDTITGTGSDNDIIFGLAGNDTLNGWSGDDFIVGGDGNDYIKGWNGNDTMVGGAGKDRLQGNYGSNIFYDLVGSDSAVSDPFSDSNNDNFYGSDFGDDLFILQAMNNTANGYAGDDTFKVYFHDNSLNGSTNTINDTDGNDRLIFANLDFYSPDYYFTYSVTGPGDLYIVYTGTQTNSFVNIYDQFEGYDAGDNAIFKIETFEFGDGTVVDFKNYYVTEGTSSTETIYGTANADYIATHNGGDTVYAGDSDDYVRGGNQNDTIYGENGDDFLFGYQGDDTLYGGAGIDRLNGEQGDDTLYGEDGVDYLYGEEGSDTLDGGLGDDYLYGQNGDDIAYGGAGADYIRGDNGNDELHGGDDNDELIGSNGNDTLYGDAGNDRIDGWADDDLIYGGLGADTLYGDKGGYDTKYTGNDTIYGEDGNDKLYGQQGNDLLYGGLGNDNLYAGDGIDTLDGGDGNDNLYGQDGTNILIGGLGNDNLYSGSGDDTVDGGDGVDTLLYQQATSGVVIDLGSGTATGDGNDTFTGIETVWGSNQNDTITGDSGDNNLNGSSGDDLVYGGLGADIIGGGSGDDTLYGGDDNDDLNGAAGNDILYGDDGDDTLDGHVGDDTLYGGTGADSLYGDDGIDILYGESGDDYLNGEDGNDTLYGGDGDDWLGGYNDDDTLYGGAGADSLYGHNGTDVLYSGSGNDTVWGGAGADHFVFESGLISEVDTIKDFDVAEGDVIDISDVLVGYDPMTSTITDFVQITDIGISSSLAVDADGGADNFVAIATIYGVTGLTDEAALLASGNLLAA